jgi:hypothetical protein
MARRRTAVLLVAALAVAALVGCSGGAGAPATEASADRFDADRAFADLRAQVALGPRPAGSAASRRLAQRLRDRLPNGRFAAVPGGLRNVVGHLPGRRRAILVGAHYDTKDLPGFVGANDGASGTAAVLEIARVLRRMDRPERAPEIRFVLFDGEEDPPGCTDKDFAFCALRGSRAYAAAHPGQIGDMILLDYIANRDAQIRREANSNVGLWDQLRQAAAEVGAEDVFPPGVQGGVIDDHYPFLAQGVPSIDLIDFSYPYADTVEDTVDKLDPAVLDEVGETVAQLVIDLNS